MQAPSVDLSASDPTGRLAADAASLDRIRAQARSDPQGAVRGAAQQFEALLIGMLLKSMRDTTSQNTPFDSEQTKMLQSMLDQQMAQVMSKRGIGLADVIARQLSQPSAGAPAPSSSVDAPQGAVASGPQAVDFINRMWPYALEAGRQTGIPPRFILAQAALESGWGRAEPRTADGSPSYNLFGIKAGRGWTGDVAQTVTTEYVNGEPQRSVERFRAYGSYEKSFLDYAALIKSRPRFAPVLESGGDPAAFARALQQSGYATDPMYADKLVRIINGSTLRTGLTG